MIQAEYSIGNNFSPIMGEKSGLAGSDKQVIQEGHYRIEQLPSQALPFEKEPRKFMTSHIVPGLSWSVYFIVEAVFIGSLDNVSGIITTCLWIGLLVEYGFFFVDFQWSLDAVLPLLKTRKNPLRAHYKLLGDTVPHVDIFITCCGEPVDVIMNSAKAAAAQDYPHSKFSVLILDDGHDDNLRYEIDRLNDTNTTFNHVHYTSRTVEPGARSYFKSGNLNHGIKLTKELTNGEFIASLDMDMVVAPDFIRRMVPHLLLNPKLGLANSPQNAYNIPKNDPLVQASEFHVWNTIYEPIHDMVDEAMCMGTGWMVRRAAIEQIGGWPLAETGEDYMCSTRLIEKGWKIADVRENMQQGIAPESFQSRMKQRMRWVDAAMEVHRSNNWYLTNDFGEGGSWGDKLASILFAIRDLSAITIFISLVILPTIMWIFVSSSDILVSTTSLGYYKLLNALLVVSVIVGKICDWNLYQDLGLGHLSNVQAFDIWCSPYTAIRCVAHLLRLPSALKATFFVTGSHVCSINERSAHSRAPVLRRITSTGIPIHIAYTFIATATIYASLQALSTRFCTIGVNSSVSPIATVLPGHILLLTKTAWKMAVPFWYMLFPPTVPDWRHFLRPDDVGVLRPKNPLPRYVTADQGDLIEMKWVREWRDGVEVFVLTVILMSLIRT